MRGVLLFLAMVGLASPAAGFQGAAEDSARAAAPDSAFAAPAPADSSAARAPRKRRSGGTPPPRQPRLRVSGSVDLQAIYDDNIFRFSPENILEFRRGVEPAKYKLDTYDDLILSPRIEVSFDRAVIGGQAANLRIRYTRWQYMSNPAKTNDSWMIRVRQPLPRRSFVEIGYTYAPIAYVRELSDRPPFAPRTTTPLAWVPFKSIRHASLLALQSRVSDRVTVRIEGGRVLRYYNRPFLENDNSEWNASLTGWFDATRSVRLRGLYAYGDTRARAVDTVGETVETTDDGDPSYKRDMYQLGLRFAPRGGIWKVSQCELGLQYQEYYFTSGLPYYLDPIHTGRKDEVRVAEITLGTSPVWREATLELGYRFTKRSSSSSASAIGAESIEEDKNYVDNRTWLGVSYPF
jgi:hypothetical protein